MKKSNSGVDTLAKYLVSGTLSVVTAGGLLSGCVVGEWTLVGPRVDRSAGAPQTQAPTSSTPSPHSRLQVPAKRGQKWPNVAKCGQMWPKEAKVAENGQKLSKGVPRG